ncbi:MAG: hypothetical protein RLN75_04475, partial [Longimicrobiales bacterium]
ACRGPSRRSERPPQCLTPIPSSRTPDPLFPAPAAEPLEEFAEDHLGFARPHPDREGPGEQPPG